MEGILAVLAGFRVKALGRRFYRRFFVGGQNSGDSAAQQGET